uniref:DUF2269 domain-containing protein n=1 Tax=Fundidesulfovibrio putealis TaxID=270496 RepID=A0A7C4EM97_9BACT
MRAPKEMLAGDHQLIDYRIRGRELRWLKTLHICFASLWAGATVCIAAIQFGFDPDTGAQMYAYRSILWLIDLWIIAPSALLCMLTGFFYSAMTSFGFVKYWWIILKWVVTIAYNVAGFLFLSPWLEHLARLSRDLPPAQALPAGSVLLSAAQGVVLGAQLGVVGSMILVTILKPWGHTRWHV